MRNIMWAALAAAALLPSVGCSTGAGDGGAKAGESAQEPFGRMTIDELEAKMADAKAGKSALFIIDNNHKEDFDKGHIPGAKWVEYDKVQASDLPQDKEATLVFYCANEH